MIDLHESPEHRTPTGTPKVLTLQDQSDIVTYYVDLFWSLLIFADLFWSFLIFSDLLRQTVRPSSTTLQPPSPLPTPVTWEVVHGWTHEWTVVWIAGSIKALSAEGNKEMNGNDTSVNSTWITQHPNTCILPHRTCTSLNVQPVQRHVTLPLEPRPMYPFFLAGPQHGGQLNLRTICWFLPLHPNASMEETEGKRTPAKHVPYRNLDCISFLISSVC